MYFCNVKHKQLFEVIIDRCIALRCGGILVEEMTDIFRACFKLSTDLVLLNLQPMKRLIYKLGETLP